MEGDVRRFLARQSWFKSEVALAELYPEAVEHLLVPREMRRKFFNGVMQQGGAPTAGHKALADLVQRQLVSTILTTNFDGLIERALEDRAPHIRSVVTINKSRGDLVVFKPQNHPQVVYLHGSFDTYCDKNTIDETRELDKRLVQKLRALTPYAPLVVIGYRGYEPSVMQHLLMNGLKDSENYSHGIFWCVRQPEDIHDRVRALAAKIGSNFSLVKIDGFDEAMEFLNEELSGAAAYQVRASAAFQAVGTVGAAGDSAVEATRMLDDLERDQLIALAKHYATEILKTDFKITELEDFLVSYGFARRDAEGGTLRPTHGLYLLTGKDVTERQPHLCISLVKDGKQQTVFKGNLLKQFFDLREVLLGPEVNPTVRIKRPEGAVEMKAYHDRAIVELLVNLMAHRDYSLPEPSFVEFDSQRSLTFVAPGGLPQKVFRRLKPDESKGGEF